MIKRLLLYITAIFILGFGIVLNTKNNGKRLMGAGDCSLCKEEQYALFSGNISG